MTELPTGWVRCRLDEVCILRNGRAYSRDELLVKGKYRVLRVGNFFTNKHWYYSDLELDDEKYCHPGDLLYAWSASFGPQIWDKERCIYHYHIWRVDIDVTKTCRDFMYYWFLWDKESIQHAEGTGTTMIHVTKGAMEARQMTLPPLPHQRRIVAKLDALSARLKRARAELERVEALAQRARNAVLAAAFLPNNPPVLLAKVISEALIGLVRSKADQGSSGTPYVRMQHFDLDGNWNEEDLTSVSCSTDELNRYALRVDDVLFNTRNSHELVGKVAICPAERSGYVYNNNLLRLRFRDDVLPVFAFRQMQSPFFRQQLAQQKSATTSVAAIYQGSLMRSLFWLPSLPEQERVVGKVEAALAKIERSRQEAARCLQMLPRLDQSILSRAFRGELVPQDPEDEPASVLLDRIRAEASSQSPKRRRRTG